MAGFEQSVRNLQDSLKQTQIQLDDARAQSIKDQKELNQIAAALTEKIVQLQDLEAERRRLLEQKTALELANDVLALRTGVKNKDKEHKRELEDRLWSLERSLRQHVEKSSDKKDTLEHEWIRGYETYKLYSTMLSEIIKDEELEKFQSDAKATSALISHTLKATLRAALNDLRTGRITNNSIKKERVGEWDESLSDTTVLTQTFLESLPKAEPSTHLQDLDQTPLLTQDELKRLADTGNILREEEDDHSLPDLNASWSFKEPQISLEDDENLELDPETYQGEGVAGLEKTVDMAEITSIEENALLTKQEQTRARRKRSSEIANEGLPDLGFPLDIRNVGETENQELSDLGFPKELGEIEESIQTRQEEKKKNDIQLLSELKNQLLSFDRQIDKLTQEEKNTRFFKGTIRKRLAQAQKTRGVIEIKHEDLLREQGKQFPEKSLQKIETQLSQQREEIARLQSVYDKAWFGRGEKLKRLEEAKIRRTDLLKRRNDLRKETGEEIEMEESEIQTEESCL